jgi:hypothetical protein
MKTTTRILFLSANPWTTSRIRVEEEAREKLEKLQEGPHRDQFELHKHEAIRPIDMQRLLMMYKPQIVHFSVHGRKGKRIILSGAPGRGKEVNCQGLVEMFGLYRKHLKLVVLNACFTKEQARALTEVVDYSVGTGRGIGDRGSVAFAGAFYRAIAFGKTIKKAFDSAKAELALTVVPRTRGIELFVRSGVSRTGRLQTRGMSSVRKAGLLPTVIAANSRSLKKRRQVRDGGGTQVTRSIWRSTTVFVSEAFYMLETSS